MTQINSVIRGRLGNQMFQYAFARWIKERCGDPDAEITAFLPNFKNELEQFSTGCRFLDHYPDRTLGQKAVMAYVNRRCRGNEYRDLHRYEKLLNRFGVYWSTDNKGDVGFYRRNRYLLYGWFENRRWGNDLGDILRREFTPSFDVLPENLDFYNMVRSTDSVCFHARYYANDYNRIPDEKDYYRRAVKEMQKRIDNPVFFIFTNKPAWAEEMLEPGKWGSEYHFEPVFNDGKKRPSVETLRLMYSCRHFIVSVSTFSWWAQFLGDADDKLVVAPLRMREGQISTGLTEDSWIRV